MLISWDDICGAVEKRESEETLVFFIGHHKIRGFGGSNDGFTDEFQHVEFFKKRYWWLTKVKMLRIDEGAATVEAAEMIFRIKM